MELDEIIEDVRKNVSQKRFNHSLGVVKRMEELAKIYHIDIEIAKKVGMAHDIAKEMKKEESLTYAQEHEIPIDEIEKIQTHLLHGKIGAHIAKVRYGFDKQMQDAIEFHTMGNIQMDLLAKLLFAADKTEENREQETINIEYEKKLADTDIDQAISYMLGEAIKENINKNSVIHPQGILTRNFFLMNQ